VTACAQAAPDAKTNEAQTSSFRRNCIRFLR
jgi:hypothetical protein